MSRTLARPTSRAAAVLAIADLEQAIARWTAFSGTRTPCSAMLDKWLGVVGVFAYVVADFQLVGSRWRNSPASEPVVSSTTWVLTVSHG